MPPPPATPARCLLDALLDLVYPRRCGGCARLGSWLCSTCLAAMEPPATPGWACAVCGRSLAPAGTGWACAAHPAGDGLVAVLAAGAYAAPLRGAIHRLKYDGWRVLADPLAALLDATCTAHPLPWLGEAAPWIVPVPLHARRARERGFNQAGLLAAVLARRLGWPLLPGLARVRYTLPQALNRLTREERALNLEDAFAWRAPGPPPAGPVLLLDDVYTSGVTMAYCADALDAVGAGPVYGLALARRSLAPAAPPA